MVSKYEKVNFNAGCTCSGNLTYSDNNIRGYNEIQRGQTLKKKEIRDAKSEKSDTYKGEKGDMRGEWR